MCGTQTQQPQVPNTFAVLPHHKRTKLVLTFKIVHSNQFLVETYCLTKNVAIRLLSF